MNKRFEGIPTKMELDVETRTLSPIGKIQAGAVRWIRKHGQPGIMHTPTALLLDHFSGWTPPRHMYTQAVYNVWGAMPYGPGDYLTHAVLSMLYPGYEDASYYHDERGFLSDTPYGDIADVLLSDAPLWVMLRYGLVVVAGEVDMDHELRDKLMAFVRNGGELVITAGNAYSLWPEWKIGPATPQSAGATVTWNDGSVDEELRAFSLCSVDCPPNVEVAARCGDTPAVLKANEGKGTVWVMLNEFGLHDDPQTDAFCAASCEPVDNPLPSPFVMLSHVRRVLDRCFKRQQAFSVGDDLMFVAGRRSEGLYTVGIFNNQPSSLPFKIQSHLGPIQSIEEMPLDDTEVKQDVGYLPEGFENQEEGLSDNANIGGRDVRVFLVSVEEQGLMCLPPPSPPPRPRDRLLAMEGISDLKESVLRCPTFFQHFDGIKVDWRYLRDRDEARIRKEREWFERQKLRILIDFSSDLNFYPGLTLLDTLLPRYEESMDDIERTFDKMQAMAVSAAVVSLHRKPEVFCDDALANDRFLAGMRDLCERARKRGVTLLLQHHPHKWFGSSNETLEFIGRVEADNLRFAMNTAHAILGGEDPSDIVSAAADSLGLVLLSAPTVDQFNQGYDAHAPLHGSGIDLGFLAGLDVPQVLDTPHAVWDDVYRDLQALSCASAIGQGEEP
ncbi:MAG: sugar phosphate isomerase/epimerase [Lentisphaerae bacterium]|nr:sugar phosphate isomerase/epimerase [Lentisphaerota bacterium]